MSPVQFRIILWTHFWNKNSHLTRRPQCYSERPLWELAQLHELFWTSVLGPIIASSSSVYFPLKQPDSAYRYVVRPGECAPLKQIWATVYRLICFNASLETTNWWLRIFQNTYWLQLIEAQDHRCLSQHIAVKTGFQGRVTGCEEEWPDADFQGEARWIYYDRFPTR